MKRRKRCDVTSALVCIADSTRTSRDFRDGPDSDTPIWNFPLELWDFRNKHIFIVILPRLANTLGRCRCVLLACWGNKSVSKADEYRRSAALMLGLAQRTNDLADKTRLLVMAEAWLNLADRATSVAKTRRRRAFEHPLIRTTLGIAEAE